MRVRGAQGRQGCARVHSATARIPLVRKRPAAIGQTVAHACTSAHLTPSITAAMYRVEPYPGFNASLVLPQNMYAMANLVPDFKFDAQGNPAGAASVAVVRIRWLLCILPCASISSLLTGPVILSHPGPQGPLGAPGPAPDRHSRSRRSTNEEAHRIRSPCTRGCPDRAQDHDDIQGGCGACVIGFTVMDVTLRFLVADRLVLACAPPAPHRRSQSLPTHRIHPMPPLPPSAFLRSAANAIL